MRYYLPVRVEPDGTCFALDLVSEHFTSNHGLTEAQEAEARRLAGPFTAEELASYKAGQARQEAYLSAFARLGGVSSDPRVTAARRRRAKREARRSV